MFRAPQDHRITTCCGMTTIWRPMNCNNSHINSATLMFAALAQFPSQRQPTMPTWSHSEPATIWWIGSMTGLVFRLIPFWMHFSGEGSQPSGTSEDTTLSNMARAVQVHPDANSVGFPIPLLMKHFYCFRLCTLPEMDRCRPSNNNNNIYFLFHSTNFLFFSFPCFIPLFLLFSL